MVLAIVLQFNSFRRTFLTFMSIPLILIGIPFGLLATGQPLSFFGTLGIISLSGIIINNAIVLIDQIDIERAQLDLQEAIVAASEKRLRPILLTSATTVLGLAPMAIMGGALWQPMAVLMMSGLADRVAVDIVLRSGRLFPVIPVRSEALAQLASPTRVGRILCVACRVLPPAPLPIKVLATAQTRNASLRVPIGRGWKKVLKPPPRTVEELVVVASEELHPFHVVLHLAFGCPILTRLFRTSKEFNNRTAN